MIGMHLFDPSTGIDGIVTAQTVSPDGLAMVRIDDHWLFARDLMAVTQG
ncbi:MAG: hypothetical protein K5872_22200 [Rhizobiaceae bacterium]|nr:hypothetical protein [Rhizobiaceae bacterium]MCV0408933.1 hypothetical protein [Rhizobiaceae bacterium]